MLCGQAFRHGATKAADNGMLFSGHDAARLLDRRQNGVFVERLHAECVDNLCGNAFSGQQASGLQGLIDFDAAGDDGNIAALAKHVCATHLELFARLIDARHRCAAHAHIHGARRFGGQLNGGLRSVVVGWNENAHVRQHAHKGDIFDHLMAAAVGAY